MIYIVNKQKDTMYNLNYNKQLTNNHQQRIISHG
jgi:hypothetical protein